MHLIPTLLSFSFMGLATTCSAESKKQSPVEVGTVKWLRNLELAKAQSAKTDKPIFLLFQEVPG